MAYNNACYEGTYSILAAIAAVSESWITWWIVVLSGHTQQKINKGRLGELSEYIEEKRMASIATILQRKLYTSPIFYYYG